LDKIKQIEASPNPNPSDPYWAEQYNIENFSSAATGGTSGVTFYPQENWSQEFTDSTMIHESGHSYSKDLWTDQTKQKAWQKAMTEDGQSPSTYADSSIDEDFSESLVMYSLSKGTACEATAKQLYPNRYEQLDKLLKVGSKTK
jgi:type VI secretion system secreted protein VgrG